MFQEDAGFPFVDYLITLTTRASLISSAYSMNKAHVRALFAYLRSLALLLHFLNGFRSYAGLKSSLLSGALVCTANAILCSVPRRPDSVFWS